MIRAGVMGATGYAGAELLRILATHPEFTIHTATSSSDAGKTVCEIYPAFQGLLDNLTLVPHEDSSLMECDVVFMAVPHKAGMLHAPRFIEAGISVVDLSADFRFSCAEDYEAAYDIPHAAPELLERAVYGQPETMREDLERLAAERREGKPAVIGCAGCYVTASILAATPAIAAGLVDLESPIIVDAISGVSGAGRKATAITHFCSADEALIPYGIPRHRHMPEIALAYGRAAGSKEPARVIFTPHLAPLKRGLLATVYLPLCEGITNEELHAVYEKAYESSSLVTTLPAGIWPKTSSVACTARAHVNVAMSCEEKLAIAVCAIDNLGKGAAAQGIQCANILFGLPEDTGLAFIANAS